ncbi:hypothetical protein [Microbacterium imperiale]|uniref:Uncharacterized protein n=1 Tax=Microbacterium imperiale TaxID=33884 RepID=A0A9W6HHD2_9MICO|nr:hypothetical protein [Microbacterium imperiale]MBP2421985.1 hypothetical protein [Microbacterium imperiale]MDS0200143.1 hypothetical protein [Microbacterium imperiale]BFE39292.1 hypothetical protein GCM10017544_02480 [Microbacterium imperiale]GLJ79842.1 hypothetical protein GCM10017586_15240 [Microbacterium imperiale]
MTTALDAVLEVFTWIGFGGAVVLAIALVVLWASDGTWLPAEAIVDHDGDGTWVRWFDDEGEANSARVDAHTAAELADVDRAHIWFRHGWRGRMRLTRRPPLHRPLLGLTWGALALGIVSVVVSTIVLFARG